MQNGGAAANAAPRSPDTGPRRHAAILADRLREQGHAELAELAERHAAALSLDNGSDSELFRNAYLRAFDPACM